MPHPRRPAPLRRLAGGVPLYVQIAESLLDRIEAGELAPGHRLPAERELSQTLGVNRMTLRQALHSLEMQGLLVRRQGAGTYVTEAKKIERQAGKLVPFTKGMTQRGYEPGAKVLSVEQRPADSAIAKELGLRTSDAVYDIHRLRLINQEPAMLETFYLPVARFARLDQFDLAKRSVYEILETEYGVTISRARQSLEPVVAAEYEARLLKIKIGAPLMLETRLAFDDRGRPVEYGRDLYRGDRFRFVTETAPLES
ncbi:MAG: GntR family transcriptional regulator [Chloroflexi bacterium]|nr:GntR family transcriptional regulator [Chloroflexota bacterium]